MNLTNLVLILGCGAVMASCNAAVQTSSGKVFNEAVPLSEKSVHRAANVEPILKFPANFCVVKTNQTNMVYSEPAEAKIWNDMAARHSNWGTFREVNPVVVNLVVSEQGSQRWNDEKAGANEIRLGAARQHCDAVLSYEARKSADGAAATAVLYDVRNGYTYTTANETGSNATSAVAALAVSVEGAMEALARAL